MIFSEIFRGNAVNVLVTKMCQTQEYVAFFNGQNLVENANKTNSVLSLGLGRLGLRQPEWFWRIKGFFRQA